MAARAPDPRHPVLLLSLGRRASEHLPRRRARHRPKVFVDLLAQPLGAALPATPVAHAPSSPRAARHAASPVANEAAPSDGVSAAAAATAGSSTSSRADATSPPPSGSSVSAACASGASCAPAALSAAEAHQPAPSRGSSSDVCQTPTPGSTATASSGVATRRRRLRQLRGAASSRQRRHAAAARALRDAATRARAAPPTRAAAAARRSRRRRAASARAAARGADEAARLERQQLECAQQLAPRRDEERPRVEGLAHREDILVERDRRRERSCSCASAPSAPSLLGIGPDDGKSGRVGAEARVEQRVRNGSGLSAHGDGVAHDRHAVQRRVARQREEGKGAVGGAGGRRRLGELGQPRRRERPARAPGGCSRRTSGSPTSARRPTVATHATGTGVAAVQGSSSLLPGVNSSRRRRNSTRVAS